MGTSALDIHGLPRIDTFGDLVRHSGLRRKSLWARLFSYHDFYSTFMLPKKRGGFRQIAHPDRHLKFTQRWVLRKILDRLHSGEHCFGFERGSKLTHNALQHVGARAVLNLDIENFFPSIRMGRVITIFRAAGYASGPASMLAYLCTHHGSLPQGAPSSPKLANLACFRLDRRLGALSASRGIIYSRYADDLTFSAQDSRTLTAVRPLIAHIVQDSGFRLNHSKSRLSGPSQARKVTGLIVRQDGVGIGRKRLRQLRAMIHHFHLGKSDFNATQIQGHLDHVFDVDPPRYRSLVQYLKRLSKDSPAGSLENLRTRPVRMRRTDR